MSTTAGIRKFIREGASIYLPSLSVDCVIFGFHDHVLRVLLLRMKGAGQWMLPGGFVLKKEQIDTAAERVLQERTGLDEIFLQQFHVFGDPQRTDAAFHRRNLKTLAGISAGKDHWITRRFVTVGYYALVEFSRVHPVPDDFSDLCDWYDIHELPPLAMDHEQIMSKALETLRLHLRYHPIGYNLLPEKFTMPQLQRLYETILDSKLDRRNFQRKMLSYGVLRRLKERKTGGAHKAPFLYRFDLRRYNKALAEGWGDSW